MTSPFNEECISYKLDRIVTTSTFTNSLLQMANSDKILEHILSSAPPSAKPITYQWLLPNIKGLDNFFSVHEKNANSITTNGYPTPPPSPTLEAADQQFSTSSPAPHEVSIFLAATEAFSKRNTNCSIAESLARFAPLITSSTSRGIPVRAYISVALGCPYEGPLVSPATVTTLTTKLLEMGACEISVADTTGMGTAPRTRLLLRTLKEAGVDMSKLAFHFHDTYGMALVNTMEALDAGIRVFDASVSGLGGCPYSPGATGNVATEDVVHLCESLGMQTGVDLVRMAEVGEWISGELGRANASSAGKAVLAKVRQDVKPGST